MQQFALSYADGLRALFAALGTGPRRSGVQLDERVVRVRMGWAFRACVPREAVRAASPDDAVVTGWGVHGWRGRWLVNGSSQGLVRLALDPAPRAWVAGWPVRLRTLRLSLTDPAGFLAALARR